jgi:Holliday junction resolvase RusA-like endonuclease
VSITFFKLVDSLFEKGILKERKDHMEAPRVKRYVINGEPFACARPRFGDGRIYDSQRETKLLVGITLESQHNEEPLFQGPLNLNISFYLPIFSAKKIKLNQQPHTQLPIITNLVKYIEEIARGIIFDQECTIAALVARKYYSTNPRTEIIVSELEKDIW